MTFQYMIRNFAEKTSMAGVSYIYGSRQWYIKAIWTFLLLLAWAVMVLHLTFLFINYFQYPKQTKISLGFSTLQFPAITICNINAIKQSKLYMASNKLKKYTVLLDPERIIDLEGDYNYNYAFDYEFYNPSTLTPSDSDQIFPTEAMTVVRSTDTPIPPIDRQTGEHAGATPSFDTTATFENKESSGRTLKRKRKKRFLDYIENLNLSHFDYYYYDYNDVYGQNYDYYNDNYDFLDTPAETMYKTEQIFKDLYMNEPRKTRRAMGHQIDDMVVSCSFAGRTCYPENFTLYQTAEYGNCYTLQSDKFVSRKSGPIGGLSIVLNLESGEYTEPFTNGKGARLVVHDRNSVPFPYEDGIYISSSFESHVGLKLFDITRLGTPFGKCETGETMKNAYGIQYTRQTCQVLCIQTSIIDTCGCYQEDEGKYLTILKKTNINHCRETHEIACMSKILVSAFNNENCDCPNPCKETVYTKTLSSHQWPTNKYATLLAYSLCMDKPGTCNGLRNTDDWRDMSLNFLKVMVYFEDLNYEQITEEPAITATQIMSDVGGAIGLWIGLCIVSIFEVVHLLIGMAVYAHGWCLHYGRSDAENRSKSKSDLEAGRTEKHQEQTYK